MSPLPLTDCARTTTYEGTPEAARYVLRWYADKQRWTPETFRARWDGASALLGWWHSLNDAVRPPLDDLSEADVRSFLHALELQGLARPTIRGYRSGASALTKALRGARSIPPSFQIDYDPFRPVHLAPLHKPPIRIDKHALEMYSPLVRARLELLLALLKLGMSVPEVCTCIWYDVGAERRFLQGYHKRFVTLGAEAVCALEQLGTLTPNAKRQRMARLLGWNADTARRWLKKVASENRYCTT